MLPNKENRLETKTVVFITLKIHRRLILNFSMNVSDGMMTDVLGYYANSWLSSHREFKPTHIQMFLLLKLR